GNLKTIERALASDPGIDAFEPRIAITGLVSSAKDSDGVLIVAVDPSRDARVTTMHTYLSKGSFLTGAPRELYIGDDLADALGLKLGDKAVVMGQAADGSMGADNYKVTGLYHTGSTTFDKQIVFVPLASLQETLAMEGRVNQFAIRLRRPETLQD